MTNRNKLLDVDDLAQFIRSIDGNNSMGAGALAEKICERFADLLQEQETCPRDFPKRIHELLTEVASRVPPEGRGVWEDENGEPMQDDADAALAWIASAGKLLQAQGEPQSSDQVWKEAIEAAKADAKSVFKDSCNHTHDAIEYMAAVMQSLKRPHSQEKSQAQEPRHSDDMNDGVLRGIADGIGANEYMQSDVLTTASAYGAVDELPPLPMPYAHSGLGLPLFCERDMREYALLVLSRAQATQPAQQASAVSDEQAEAAAHSVCIGSNASTGVQRSDMRWTFDIAGVRALLSQPAAEPEQEHGLAALRLQTANKALQFYADRLTDDGSVARVALHATQVGAAPVSECINTSCQYRIQSQGGDKP